MVAQANATVDAEGNLIDELVSAREGSERETRMVTPDRVQYIDVAPSQIVSAAASLVPFLEHDDANRALMGANMQRRAVPCLRPDKPRSVPASSAPSRSTRVLPCRPCAAAWWTTSTRCVS